MKAQCINQATQMNGCAVKSAQGDPERGSVQAEMGWLLSVFGLLDREHRDFIRQIEMNFQSLPSL